MKLIIAALRHPITILVAVIGIVFFSWLAVRNTKVDIFPKLGLPTVYVAQPYGGLSPEQMEGFITSYYEYHFLYITGVKYVDSKSIQGAALIKIEFNEGTDMSQAMAEVVGYVNRSRAFMPPGTVPPFITRFDAGSVPVGQLVFSSETRSLGEIADLALFKVRPMFSTLPGVSAPPPFGGNQKTVLITVDPDKIRNYHVTPDQVVQSLVKTNTISPAGNVRIGDSTYITPQNSVIENLQDLQNMPLQLGSGPAVYVKDIGNVSLGSDVTTSYALVNGKRSVYIPVTKRADASTWEVVQRVKAALPDMQAAIPEDIKVSYEFDQSGYVINALKSLLFEGGLGALLTGLMVLLFLGDRRGALIVVLTIPLALLASATFLYLTGQTINIMTLGGLALSVGILVDEATVTIENIHRHMEMGKSKARAIADASKEIAIPKLLILLSILAVFVPALFMNGVPRALFLPLSLAVGFAMIASFLLSQTFVPVMGNWLMKHHLSNKEKTSGRFNRFKNKYAQYGRQLQGRGGVLSVLFLAVSVAAVILLFTTIGTELFPASDTGQTQVRLRLPVGTRMERTEDATRQLLTEVNKIAGPENVLITSAFVGTQPSSFPVNYIHLWTGGPHESVTRIKLKPGVIGLNKFKDQLRAAVAKEIPAAKISFEPGDLSEQVLNLGTTNPIEIAVVNKNLEEGRKTANWLYEQLAAVPYLKDVQIATPLNYPAIKIDVDRVKAAQLNLTTDQITKSTTAATSSSRFTSPAYWLDKTTGTAYIIQVQYPEYRMNNTTQLEMIPVAADNGNLHLLNEVASWKRTTIPGEYDRLNQQRYLTITANVQGRDLGSAFKKVNELIKQAPVPKGAKIIARGQPELLNNTLSSLQFGLLVAVVVIFLLMTVYFQSFRTAVTILSVVPAVVAGSLLFLLLTGKTLNIQSYMGCIMAIGVAIANAVLFITAAEVQRKAGDLRTAYLVAAESRLRPILMTSLAMIAGMLPMAIGLGESGDQMAPLGIAVIGGLVFSTISVLFFLPPLYQYAVGKKNYVSASLDPDDVNSKNFNEQ
ncbi:acriflavin resistance protein [Niastella yeongjuensis]|uniref:Acriflavin resistance protein n=1 Tax=Niastella yeongjuensis TaxID=354355 RepID=A0A1V9E9J1_9BACT|nr:efflux RND transporter permease subunit [Niastella yeongjuensis]OQP42790.1 acriflavin resistance protein [Niastella yeongjuensis]SEO54090.1 Multidrug efflux pump subunit AcrB [Niastella yeongjuensis]